MEKLLSEFPDDTGGVGIDARVARELRGLILDQTILIPPSGRSTQEQIGSWDKEKLLEYSLWLCDLLDIHPGESNGTLKAVHLADASKLELGPGIRTFTANSLKPGRLQEALRLEGSERYKFRYWSREQIIEKGMELAEQLGRRPSARELDDLNKRGRFLNRQQLERRFGSLTYFHETIGWPSCYSWHRDDHLEWGVAVKRQNSGLINITQDMLAFYAAMNRGPSEAPIYKHFGSINSYDFEVDKSLEAEKQHDKLVVEEEYRAMDKLKQDDPILSQLVAGKTDEEALDITAKYRLIRHFLPSFWQSETHCHISVRRIVKKSSDEVATWLVDKAGVIDVADIEHDALLMGIFDRLWPMKRFQNVDLVLPDDWRAKLKEIKLERAEAHKTKASLK